MSGLLLQSRSRLAPIQLLPHRLGSRCPNPRLQEVAQAASPLGPKALGRSLARCQRQALRGTLPQLVRSPGGVGVSGDGDAARIEPIKSKVGSETAAHNAAIVGV